MTNKIKDILKTHKYLLLSFFLPVLLLEGIAIAEKIQPFGSESFLIVDALHQYLPFFADYQEKLKSMDSMFYSFHAGLGYNFLGLWAYYLASPLNLVIALVSKSMLTMILSHLYVLKIALCCFTAAFYFRKRRGKDEISIVAFGMAYGLCSYMVGYSWNIMWMEVMMMLPLILYGIDKLIKEHDGRLYCFALFISLWCNFYMSYMTCLFLILWYLLYSHNNVKEFLQMDSALQDIHCYLEQWQRLCYCQLTLGSCRHPQPNYNFQKNYGMEHLEICFPDIFLGQHRLRWR